jgi:hypothetical protein
MDRRCSQYGDRKIAALRHWGGLVKAKRGERIGRRRRLSVRLRQPEGGRLWRKLEAADEIT